MVVFILIGSVSLAYLLALFMKDVLNAMSAASWGSRAFSRRELAAAGINITNAEAEGYWEEGELPSAAPVRQLRPALAWRALRPRELKSVSSSDEQWDKLSQQTRAAFKATRDRLTRLG